MMAREDVYGPVLARAVDHTRAWLRSLNERHVGPRAAADELAATFAGVLPDDGCDPTEVLDLLAVGADPGLMAMPSGRFFGWVIGGSQPAALGADWLVSAWDQNSALRYATCGCQKLGAWALSWGFTGAAGLA